MFVGVKSLKHNVRTTLRFSGDSRISKVESHFGAKEKVGANVNIYLAWTFFMLTKRT